VGIGTLATACLVLSELDRFARLLDPATDDTGLLMEREAVTAISPVLINVAEYERLPKLSRTLRFQGRNSPNAPGLRTICSGNLLCT